MGGGLQGQGQVQEVEKRAREVTCRASGSARVAHTRVMASRAKPPPCQCTAIRATLDVSLVSWQWQLWRWAW